MTEDRDKWRKYVHGVANPRIEEGYGTEQNSTALANRRVVKMSSLPFQLVCAMSRCRTILRFNGLFSASTGYPSVILYLFQKRTVNDKRHKLNGSTSCHPRNKVDVEHMIYRPTFGQKCVLRVTKQEHQNNLIEKWIKFISWFFLYN